MTRPSPDQTVTARRLPRQPHASAGGPSLGPDPTPRPQKVTRLPGAFSRLAQDVAQVIGDRAPADVLERILLELELADAGDPTRQAFRYLLESGAVTGPMLAWEGDRVHLVGIRPIAPEETLAQVDALIEDYRFAAVSCSLQGNVWVLLRAAARRRFVRLLETHGLRRAFAIGVDLCSLSAAPGERAALEDLLGAGALRGRQGLVDDLATLCAVRVDALLDAAHARPALAGGPMDPLLSQPQNLAFALTLYHWFACNQDTAATAVAMHLHANTVRYRLRRALEITGVDLGDGNQRLLAETQLRIWHRVIASAPAS